ncbi:MAG: patatin-like phospholipase family protein [Syntrophomonas sp.]
MKTLGLALGGGGLKGLAHIGVLEVLAGNRIPVDLISGTSAGSIIAALYASGLSPRSMEKLVLNLKSGDYLDYNISGLLRYLIGFYMPGISTHVNGIIKGDKLESLVYKLTEGKSLKDISMPLAIIACDIDTGREVIFTNQDIEVDDDSVVVIRDALLSEAVRASISIPGTFVPLCFRGMKMIDGGVKNIVPVDVQKKMGAEYIAAVNLGQETYETKVTGIVQIISRSLDILTYQTSDTAEEFFADVEIFPRVSGVHLDEMEKAEQIIRAGRRAARDKIGEIKNELRF